MQSYWITSFNICCLTSTWHCTSPSCCTKLNHYQYADHSMPPVYCNCTIIIYGPYPKVLHNMYIIISCNVGMEYFHGCETLPYPVSFRSSCINGALSVVMCVKLLVYGTWKYVMLGGDTGVDSGYVGTTWVEYAGYCWNRTARLFLALCLSQRKTHLKSLLTG